MAEARRQQLDPPTAPGLHHLNTFRRGAHANHTAVLGITLAATSLAYFAYRVAFPQLTEPPRIVPFGEVAWLGTFPLLGSVLGAVTPLTLLALLLTPVTAWILYRTPLGLALRMVGENPAAAEGAGIDVTATRIGA